jgi:hypothetical protein
MAGRCAGGEALKRRSQSIMDHATFPLPTFRPLLAPDLRAFERSS